MKARLVTGGNGDDATLVRHRRVFRGYLLGFIVAALIGVFLMGWNNTMMSAMPNPAPARIDFSTLDLGTRQNAFLVCPEGYCAATPGLISPTFDMPATALRDRWMRMIKTRPRVTLAGADDAALQYDFVQRSRFLKFPDSITVRFIPIDDSRATLAIYSRAHYGRSDFGVNQDRVTEWLAALTPPGVATDSPR